MKLIALLIRQERFVAKFGYARLIESRRGGYELRGGTQADRTAAKEWISLFQHDAVPRLPVPPEEPTKRATATILEPRLTRMK